MQKIIVMLSAILFFTGLCPAEENKDTVMLPDAHEPLVKEIRHDNTRIGTVYVGTATFTGKLESIAQPTIAQGLKYEITVTDKGGNTKVFSLIPGRSIMEQNGNLLPVGALQVGDKVSVEYTVSRSGVNRAVSVIRQES